MRADDARDAINLSRILQSIETKYRESMTELKGQQARANDALEAFILEHEAAMDMLASMSITYTGKDYVSGRAKLCSCGASCVVIQPYMYEPGGYIVKCKTCDRRSVEKPNPIAAIKAWNAEELTEASEVSREPLTARNMDDNAASALMSALRREAVVDLMCCEKSNRLDSPLANEARGWIRDKKVIADIESGDRRRREEEEARLRKEEDAKHRKGDSHDISGKRGRHRGYDKMPEGISDLQE